MVLWGGGLQCVWERREKKTVWCETKNDRSAVAKQKASWDIVQRRLGADTQGWEHSLTVVTAVLLLEEPPLPSGSTSEAAPEEAAAPRDLDEPPLPGGVAAASDAMREWGCWCVLLVDSRSVVVQQEGRGLFLWEIDESRGMVCSGPVPLR